MNRLHIVTEGPADNLPVIQVKNHRHEHPASRSSQAGDIRHPFLPYLFGLKLPIQDILTDPKSIPGALYLQLRGFTGRSGPHDTKHLFVEQEIGCKAKY
jgi:hypothetical protein